MRLVRAQSPESRLIQRIDDDACRVDCFGFAHMPRPPRLVRQPLLSRTESGEPARRAFPRPRGLPGVRGTHVQSAGAASCAHSRSVPDAESFPSRRASGTGQRLRALDAMVVHDTRAPLPRKISNDRPTLAGTLPGIPRSGRSLSADAAPIRGEQRGASQPRSTRRGMALGKFALACAARPAVSAREAAHRVDVEVERVRESTADGSRTRGNTDQRQSPTTLWGPGLGGAQGA
jgi:hypothetical protein